MMIRTFLNDVREWFAEMAEALVSKAVAPLVRKELDPAQNPGLDEMLELVPTLLAVSLIVGAVAHIVKSKDLSDEVLITIKLDDGVELEGTLDELTTALQDVEAGK